MKFRVSSVVTLQYVYIFVEFNKLFPRLMKKERSFNHFNLKTLQKYASFICLIHSHEKTCDFLFYFFGFFACVRLRYEFLLKRKNKTLFVYSKNALFSFFELEKCIFRKNPSIRSTKEKNSKTNKEKKALRGLLTFQNSIKVEGSVEPSVCKPCPKGLQDVL